MRQQILTLAVVLAVALLGLLGVLTWRSLEASTGGAQPALSHGSARIEEARETPISPPAQAPSAAESAPVVVPSEPSAAQRDAVPAAAVPEDRIELLIEDDQGAPVPLALVSFTFNGPEGAGVGMAAADERGVFVRHLQASQRAPHDFQVTHPSQPERFPPVHVRGLGGSEDASVVRFERRPAVHLLVLDEQGMPVKGLSFSTFPLHDASQVVVGAGQHRSASLSEGEIEVFLGPEKAVCMVRVHAEGFADAVCGPYGMSSAGQRVELRMRALPPVRGVVLSATGTPLSGAQVRLQVRREVLTPSNASSIRTRELLGGVNLVLGSPQAKIHVTDEAGCFAVWPKVSGTFDLHVSGPGYAATLLGPLELDVSTGAEGLVVELFKGGTLEGRVTDPSGAAAEGILVKATSESGLTAMASSDKLGQYVLARLDPGPWRVEVFEGAGGIGGPPLWKEPWRCLVREQATTQLDLIVPSK